MLHTNGGICKRGGTLGEQRQNKGDILEQKDGEEHCFTNYCFKEVQSFTYLGPIIISGNDKITEIKKRIAAGTGNSIFYSLLQIMNSRNVHEKTKLLVYKDLVLTVVSFGWVPDSHTKCCWNAGHKWKENAQTNVWPNIKSGKSEEPRGYISCIQSLDSLSI